MAEEPSKTIIEARSESQVDPVLPMRVLGTETVVETNPVIACV